MSTDSAYQLSEARSLELQDHHPITMSLIWHCLDRLVEGPLLMLVLNSVLYWFGLTAILATLRWPLLLRALAIPVVGFLPPVYWMAGAIWKDTLMQAALLAVIACFLIYERARRWPWLALGLLFCVLAMLVRHNGAAAAWPLLLLPLVHVKRLAKLSTRLRVLVGLAAGLVSALVLSLALSRATAPLAGKTYFWQLIATFDIAGASIWKEQMLFDADSPVLRTGTTLRDLERVFRVRDHLSLYKCRKRGCVNLMGRTDNPEELAKLASNWRRVVLQEPLAYLKHRWVVYYFVIGLDGGRAKLNYGSRTAYTRHYPLSDRARELTRVYERSTGSDWFRAWPFIAMSLVATPIALVLAFMGRALLPLVLLLSGLSYSASMFLAAGAPDFRYSVWTVLASVLGLVTLLQPHLFRRRAKEPPQPAATEPVATEPAEMKDAPA